METIQAELELRGRFIRVRVRTWPDQRDLLRAQLSTTPQHPRATLELLEAIARWEGAMVHAAVTVDASAYCGPMGIFPDLMPEASPLVVCDFVGRQGMHRRDRRALSLRGGGRDEGCVALPTTSRRT